MYMYMSCMLITTCICKFEGDHNYIVHVATVHVHIHVLENSTAQNCIHVCMCTTSSCTDACICTITDSIVFI